MSKKLRIVFAGTPEFAAHSLQAILDSQHEVIAVYTQPDRPSGRGKKIKASAVKQLAQEHNISVYQPLDFKDQQDVDQLASLDADLMVVVAYGIILKSDVLNTPRFGCINVHASLLPRWRGAAPIERSLLAGDSQTGITIMQMDEGLDTGDMLHKEVLDIQPTMTSAHLHDALIPIAKRALTTTLDAIVSNQITPEPQDEQLTCYASKIFKAEGNIDWSLSANKIELLIRGLIPRPVAFSHYENNTIRIWSASNTTSAEALHSISSEPGTISKVDKTGIEVTCGQQSSLLITSLQLPSAKQITVQQLLNSKPDYFRVGTKFSNDTGN